MKPIHLIAMILLAGCSSVSNSNKNMYEQGYRLAAQENFKQIAAEFQGGEFPYYHWTSPIVQQVRIPAHVGNGVMIPAHDELVIIKPGEWSLSSGYPINTKESKNDNNQISYFDVSDITALPKAVGKPGNDTGREAQGNPRGMEESDTDSE